MSMIIKIEPEGGVGTTASYHIEDVTSLFQTCRLCLSEESVESVFDEEGLQQWISDYLAIEISSEDHLSQAVCSICRIQLMEFHQFRERCHEVQSALKSEIRTENVDTSKEKAVIEPSLGSRQDQLLLETIQNVVADEFVDIADMNIGTHTNMEGTTSPEHTNGMFFNLEQATADEIEDNAETNQPIECKICHKIFSSVKRLESHERVAHRSQKYECVPCGIKTFYRSHYESHMRTIGHVRKIQDIKKANGEYVPKLKYQCSDCPASYPIRSQLYNHRARRHKEKKFVCTVCSHPFVNSHDLYRHFTTKHTSDKNRPFTCDICQKTFKLKYAMNEHKKRVHGPKLFVCSVCGSNFSTNGFLNRHMNTVHQDT
ncbi:zinc finger protein 248-like [Aedes albopictus]|uniref:C2h2-type zn-finger protein n=1 Tax=Aedes albopictus TaxID=7160 RepID=A0ABM1ZYQ2_AEDAL